MTTSAPEALLLDTPVWIWLVRGEGRLPQQILDRLFVASGRRSMFLSIMSIWEVGLLDAKGRLRLNLPCLAWVRTALERSGALTAQLTPEIAIEGNLLPGQFHNDPVDRLLVATARVEDLTLVTRDRTILEYAAEGHVRALAC